VRALESMEVETSVSSDRFLPPRPGVMHKVRVRVNVRFRVNVTVRVEARVTA
jgi:hypothetical protein